jgi:aminoglycoside 3'-phosphotransferase-2
MADNNEAITRTLLDPSDARTARFEPVASGMSGATVIRVVQPGRSDRFAKIADAATADALRNEVTRTAWLWARGITVPRVLRVNEQLGGYAVLMDAVPGTSADISSLPVPQLVGALAKALAALHRLPPDDCPFDETLSTRLSRAVAAVAAGEIDIAEFEPRNRDIAPEMLLARLTAQQRAEDIVVVHGDATLSNLIVDTDGNVGFIDCGNAGRGDRYIDLALLAADIEGHYGADARRDFIATYGEGNWDVAKSSYYLDLYELF